MQKFDLHRNAYYFQLRNSPARIVIEQGGTASGKTYTTLQVLFDIAISERDRVITIVGQDIPNLKKGAYRDAKRIWASEPHINACFDKPNETDRIFKCERTGSIIEFTSYSDELDARSGKRDYLFVNEANGIPYQVFWQLYIRTKYKAWIDYNPTTRFWAHDLVGQEDTEILYTDHRNNDFLTEEQHRRIESIQDPELFRVYARGMTGAISGVIYRNWRLCNEMPSVYKWRVIGMDFGYNDPTAIVDVRFSDGELWMDEICYQSEMLTPEIAQTLHENELDHQRIVADCAGKSYIAELKRIHHFLVEPSLKGDDSIRHGIDQLSRYRWNITRRSRNIRKEIETYKWKVDNDGNTLNVPIDEFNHAMDAIRYAATSKLGRTGGGFQALGTS